MNSEEYGELLERFASLKGKCVVRVGKVGHAYLIEFDDGSVLRFGGFDVFMTVENDVSDRLLEIAESELERKIQQAREGKLVVVSL